MSKKQEGWQHALTRYLAGVAYRPFKAGKLDCALFTAGAVAAMTGEDPATGWRGTYRSLKKGQSTLRAAGFEDHVALAASLYPEVPPLMAQPGDVAVVPTEEGLALGIVQGAQIYVMSRTGLTLVPLTAATRAFRV